MFGLIDPDCGMGYRGRDCIDCPRLIGRRKQNLGRDISRGVAWALLKRLCVSRRLLLDASHQRVSSLDQSALLFNCILHVEKIVMTNQS